MDIARLKHFIETFWEDSILPSITEYIRIPNKSPAFDPQWAEHGYMEDAVKLMEGWAREQLGGFARRHARSGAAARPHAAHLHGGAGRQRRHRAALRPSRQAARDERLGRRASAPGCPCSRTTSSMAAAAPTTAMRSTPVSRRCRALHEQKVPRGRCVIMIEACEESGSYDLPFYVDHLLEPHRQAVARRLSRLGLRRLRPAVAHHLAARDRGRHAHGARADRGRAFRRRVRHRAVLLPHPARAAVAPRGRGHRASSSCPISMSRSRRSASPRPRRRRAFSAAKSTPSSPSPDRRGRCWTISVSSCSTAPGGRSSRSSAWTAIPCRATPATCCCRIQRPSSACARRRRWTPRAVQAMKQALEADPPYGAEISFSGGEGQSGWHAPPLAPWLEKAVAQASEEAFGQPPAYMGEGGTIPFMGMLGEKVPRHAVRHHRRAGPALQRARPQRIPAHSHRQARHDGRGALDRCPSRPAEDITGLSKATAFSCV